MNKSKPLVKYLTIITDMLGVVLSFGLALILRFGSPDDITHIEAYKTLGVLLLSFTLFYGIWTESGRAFIRRGYFVELTYRVRATLSQGIFLGLCVFFLRLGKSFSRKVFIYGIVISFIITLVLRCLEKKIIRTGSIGEQSGRKVVVVGPLQSLDPIRTTLKKKLDYNFLITDCIPWEGDEDKLIEGLRTIPMDEVFIYLPGVSGEVLSDIIAKIGAMGVVCRLHLDIPGLSLQGASPGEYGGYPSLTFGEDRDYGSLLILKRLMDVAGGIVGCAITLIMLPFVAIAIKLDSEGPVVFSQIRIGKNGRRFKIYKFRSMYRDAEERKKELEDRNQMRGLMFKMEDDPRITRVGSFLRKTSLDEFPQFLNVLKGEMSLVGTRPPTEAEFMQYTPHYRRRLCMTPGLTGLWQVSGRSGVEDFDQVVKLDLEYIDNWSIGLDIKIIIQTVGVVLTGRGAK